ncbi:prephenate dehydratase [Salinicoccus sp. HZC-1]|uniref:prephenate dehydratase n=1 Tax=Salinicoccus sp. HZC-1 TaxID=3385497 RepID=UPI00398AD4BA
MLIGYQGVEGSYSELACKKFAGDAEYQMKGYPTFRTLVEAMMDDQLDYIALPVENSTSGPITRTIDLMKYLEVSAVEEVYIKIDHALITKTPMEMSEVTTVYSHPEALEQCYAHLSQYPNIEIREYADTAEAVKMVKESTDQNLAGIAGSHAAELYDMTVIRENISDNPLNTTRFLFFRKGIQGTRTGMDKTSLYIESNHSTGSLSEILNIFRSHEINLLNLTSRPIQNKPFSYGFFIDVEKGKEDSILTKALQDIGEVSKYINMLGTYQKGEIPSYEGVLVNE